MVQCWLMCDLESRWLCQESNLLRKGLKKRGRFQYCGYFQIKIWDYSIEMCCFLFRDGPSLQKLSKFEIIDASSAGTTTRQTYKLTHGYGLSPNERLKLVQSLCAALKTQFEDTTQGVVQATAIADFKMSPQRIW